jgi:hypothetical protein
VGGGGGGGSERDQHGWCTTRVWCSSRQGSTVVGKYRQSKTHTHTHDTKVCVQAGITPVVQHTVPLADGRNEICTRLEGRHR